MKRSEIEGSPDDRQDSSTSFHSAQNDATKINAYSYLIEKRKLSDALIGQLGLGYAPSQSQSLFSYFQGQGFSVEDLMQAGLAKQ